MTAAPLVTSGYTEIARRRWPVLLVALGVGLVGAQLVGSGGGETYTSESRVALRAIVVDPFQPNVRPEDSIDLATEREQAASAPVLGRAAELLGIDDPPLEEVGEDLEVSVVGDAQVLRIAFTAAGASDAQLWTAAITEAYLEQREARARELVDSMVSVLDTQIEDLEASIPPEDLPAATASGTVGDLRQQRTALLSLPTEAGQVLRPATLPTDQSGAPPWVGQVGVLGLALLVGCGAAVALDRSDDSVHSVAEVADVAGPVLGTLSLVDAPDRGWWRMRGAGATVADSARIIQLRLNRLDGGAPRTLVVTAPHEFPPVVEVGRRLASALGTAGTHVLLVTPGRDGLPQGHPTLVDLGAERATLDEATYQAGPGLSLIEVGEDGWGPGVVETLHGLRSELLERFAVVMVVAPAVLEGEAAGLELAAAADAVVLVIGEHGTEVAELTMAVDALDSVGATFAGTVVAQAARSSVA